MEIRGETMMAKYGQWTMHNAINSFSLGEGNELWERLAGYHFRCSYGVKWPVRAIYLSLSVFSVLQ